MLQLIFGPSVSQKMNWEAHGKLQDARLRGRLVGMRARPENASALAAGERLPRPAPCRLLFLEKRPKLHPESIGDVPQRHDSWIALA